MREHGGKLGVRHLRVPPGKTSCPFHTAIGTRDPNEVCTYPDSGKIMVRSLNLVGRLDERPYMDGETSSPRIFDQIAAPLADTDQGDTGAVSMAAVSTESGALSEVQPEAPPVPQAQPVAELRPRPPRQKQRDG